MCDEPWIGVTIVEGLARTLLPKGYTLKSPEYNEHRFDVHREGVRYPVAGFFLSPLVGCECAAVISHGAWVSMEYQRQGLGTALLKIRTEAVKQAGLGLALATVRSDNEVERKMLYKAGWRRARSFTPYANANHKVQLWILRPESA